jgi:hypothetical protein
MPPTPHGIANSKNKNRANRTMPSNPPCRLQFVSRLIPMKADFLSANPVSCFWHIFSSKFQIEDCELFAELIFDE